MPGTSNKHLVWAGALVLVVIVVAAAAVLIAVFVGQYDTVSESNASNSNSSSTPSTSPPVTLPPPTTDIVTQAPIIVPAPTLPTAAPSEKVMPNLAAVMNTGIPASTQGPATMEPSICQSSPICIVKNELWPFLPDSTRAKLNDTESCQYSILEWIADSDLSLERITQRYALAVLDCEMNLTNDPTRIFLVNECDWLAAISGVDPCNGDDIVESLMLSGKQLTGTLPPELSMMSNITVIDFSFNQINGTIPSELGNLTRLQELVLNNTNLTGFMPNEVCALHSLKLLETLVVDCPSSDQSLQQTGVRCSCCTNSCTLE